MPQFGEQSSKHLATCHHDMQGILIEAIRYTDFSVICGHRCEEEQNAACDGGFSMVRWPDSEHNCMPSNAADILPHPFTNWEDHAAFYLLATYVLRASHRLGIEVVWGGHFRTLPDLAHYQLGSRL